MIKDLNALIERAKVVVNDEKTTEEIRNAVSNLFDFQPTFVPRESGWVDLGLPSGTLWYDHNAKLNGKRFFTHEEAQETFGEYLPSAASMAELYENCEWEWTGKGYKVTGPNGNSIFLPAEGRKGVESDPYGYYWTRCVSKTSQSYARDLSFNSGNVGPLNGSNRSNGISVRPCREY